MRSTPAGFRNHIGQDGFEAEAGRYHLYVSLACPWANRCLATLYLKVGCWLVLVQGHVKGQGPVKGQAPMKGWEPGSHRVRLNCLVHTIWG